MQAAPAPAPAPAAPPAAAPAAPGVNINIVGVPWYVTVLLGIVILFFGRRLYWAFIAIAGFLVGMQLANEYLADKNEWIRLAASIGAGVLGAIIGMFLQRLAFAIAGFFAGAYVAFRIFEHFHPGGDHHIWMIVGGVIGAIIAAIVMDWAIIFISAIAGAAAILSSFPNLEPQMANVLFLLLACIGIVFQSQLLAGPPAPPPPRAP
jgi:Domain of unknown function (DUF4203)